MTSLHQKNGGFTLIELLVVLAIIGIIFSAVSLTGQGFGGGQTPAQEAKRLMALIGLVHEEAILDGKPLGFAINDHRYYFFQLQPDGFSVINKDEQLAPKTFPETVTIEFLQALSPLASSLKAQSAPAKTTTKTVKPMALFYATGEVTPFEIQLTSDDDDEPAQLITMEATGKLTLTTLEK